MKRLLLTLGAVSLFSGCSSTETASRSPLEGDQPLSYAHSGDRQHRADGQRAWEGGLSDRWVYKTISPIPPGVQVEEDYRSTRNPYAGDSAVGRPGSASLSGTSVITDSGNPRSTFENDTDRAIRAQAVDKLGSPSLSGTSVITDSRNPRSAFENDTDRAISGQAVGGTGNASLSGTTVVTESGYSRDTFENETDRAISERIRAGLNNGSPDKTTTTSDQSCMDNMEITTQNGVVTLRGDVNSRSEKKRIAKRAKAMDGVRSVKNELRVRPE